MSNVGFRIFTKVDRPPRDLVDCFRDLNVADIGDVMNNFNCVDQRIRPVNDTRFVGPAITVRVRAGDNLMIHKALDLAQPGDVIVIDGHGDLVNALVGENLVLWAMKRGAAGMVVDGAIRDIDALKAMNFPIYAAGITPSGTHKNGGGEVNVPVCCGRVVVAPGDIIAGDADGLVVVPARDAADVFHKIQAKLNAEATAKSGIAAGDWHRPACTDAAVQARGCEIIDGTC